MKFANMIGYSDVEPYEVVRVISDKTIEIRGMDYQQDFKPEFEVGGFSAVCVNNYAQKWTYESNTSNPVIRIRLGKKGWKDSWGRRFKLSDKPIKFYDYNF